MADLSKVRQVKNRHEKKWMAREGVVGVGIGKAEGEMGIIISVSGNEDKCRNEIENRIDGVPVTIQETGAFEAQ